MINYSSLFKDGYWRIACAVVVLIYCTIPISRDVFDFVESRNLIDQSIFIGFVLLISTLVLAGFFARLPLKALLVFAIIVVVFMFIMRGELSPAERSHLIEYSLVGWLLAKAFDTTHSNSLSAWLMLLATTILTGIFGLFDELIQLFFPDRVFDLFDILFNLLAGFIGATIYFATAKINGWLFSYRNP